MLKDLIHMATKKETDMKGWTQKEWDSASKLERKMDYDTYRKLKQDRDNSRFMWAGFAVLCIVVIIIILVSVT